MSESLEARGNAVQNVPELRKLPSRRSALAIFSAAIFSAGCGERTNGPSEQITLPPAEPTSPNRSMRETGQMTPEQVQNFWLSHLVDEYNLIQTGEYPTHGVQRLYTRASEQIREKYGTDPQVTVYASYNPLSRLVIAGTSVNRENVPSIGFSTPTIVDIYNQLVLDGDPYAHEKIQNTVLIAIMHERDHLSSGYVLSPDNTDTGFEARIYREKHTWAITCQNTIEILVRNNEPIEESDMLRYRAWIQAGRNVDSPIWDEAIRNIHNPIR